MAIITYWSSAEANANEKVRSAHIEATRKREELASRTKITGLNVRV
jgi:heme-degrading monooxygenase HmoA